MEKVFVAECTSYDSQSVKESLRTAVDSLGVELPQNKAVLLHPDAPWAHDRFAPHAFTAPAVIRAAGELLSNNDLTIATNSLPGFPTRYTFGKAGYKGLAGDLDAELVPVDEAATRTVSLGEGASADKEADLPEVALDADFTVALPKLTGSTFVSLAAAIRHHQSLLQDDAQMEHHGRLNTKMVDLLGAALPHLVVVDAVEATHQGGELSGRPVDLGVLIVGTNVVAVDTICALAYGLDPADLKYLQLASKRGFGSADPQQIEVVGDLSLADLKGRAQKVEHVDPAPENFPLPSQVTLRRSPKAPLAGVAGALTETLFTLKHAGISLDGARETAIVIGSVDEVPDGEAERATIIFLGDTARASYTGYSRVVRLRGRYVPLRKQLNDVPYAMKVGYLRNEVGMDFNVANIVSKLQRFLNSITG